MCAEIHRRTAVLPLSDAPVFREVLAVSAHTIVIVVQVGTWIGVVGASFLLMEI